MENDDLELACGCKHSSLSKFYLSHSFTVGNATSLLELQGGKPDSAAFQTRMLFSLSTFGVTFLFQVWHCSGQARFAYLPSWGRR